MLMKAQMVPMPITAAEKFKEAAFFYNAMLAVRTNVRMFPYYLSAFLAALRSVTDYIEQQTKDHPDLRTWWKETFPKLKDDPLLKFLKRKRDLSIHQEPLNVFFWHGPTFPKKHLQKDEDGEEYIESNYFGWSSTTDERGEIRVTMQVGKDGVDESVETNVNWTFEEDDEKGIAAYCYDGLEKVDALVKEFAELRAKLGLPDEPDPPGTMMMGSLPPSTLSEP
jgi:hypothetical protein